MQRLKEGHGRGKIVRTRGLDQGDGSRKRATAPASDALKELVLKRPPLWLRRGCVQVRGAWIPASRVRAQSIIVVPGPRTALTLSLIHISEPTRLGMISYAVFCLKKKKK